jgi:FkbM family methyltransferase
MPSTKLQQFVVSYTNSEEYHRLKTEIFTHDCYYFETDNPTPRIIDAGAHIGLATLYFKKLYPAAQIIAIEPHPANLELLEKNIWENNLEDIEVVPVALSRTAGQQEYFSDASRDAWFSTAGFLQGAWNQGQNSQSSQVKTETLGAFLQEPIDFLKMDIEGAEQEVLQAAGDQLGMVKHLMVEFHPHPGQDLVNLVTFLQERGFTTTVWKDGQEVKPKHVRGLVLVEAVQT